MISNTHIVIHVSKLFAFSMCKVNLHAVSRVQQENGCELADYKKDKSVIDIQFVL